VSGAAIVDRVDALDTTLFDPVLSQTQDWDRRALLALHSAVAAAKGSFTYLEIGSYLGGSLQAPIQDPRCSTILSIDSRPDAPPDKRTGVWAYEDNSTAHMVRLLSELPNADMGKLVTFDVGTEALSPSDLPARPDYCFIDGEHTDEAVLRDARFCANALGGRGVIAFHDHDVVEPAIRTFLREAWRDVSMAIAFNGLVFALELGGEGVLRSDVVDRAIASRWHSAAWRLASRPRRSPLPLLGAWTAIPIIDRAVVNARQIGSRRPRRDDT
jgi:hypothetical protein